MLTGRSGYDVVFPSAVPLARQVRAGAIGRLDKSKLPNLSHMDPVVMERIALNDPGNAHAIPYMWGTAGIGYNPDKVEKALGTARDRQLGAPSSIPRSRRGSRSAASR